MNQGPGPHTRRNPRDSRPGPFILVRNKDMEPRKFTPRDQGVWLDGALGWHNSYRVLQLAAIAGMEFDPETRDALNRYEEANKDGQDTEIIHDAVEEATEFLDSLAPDGYTVSWDAGELGMWRVESED